MGASLNGGWPDGGGLDALARGAWWTWVMWSPRTLLIVLDVAMITLLVVVPCEREVSALEGLKRDRILFIV
jgi:hypothetical protein